MSLRSSIYAQLATNSILNEQGIYCDAIPQKEAYPCVLFVFKKINYLYTLDGITKIGRGQTIMSLFSYDKDDCEAGIEIVKTLFNGFKGTMGDIVVRQAMKLVDEGDAEYNAPDGSSKVLFEMKQVYSINFQE